MNSSDRRMSGFADGANLRIHWGFPTDSPKQNYPEHYPRSNEPLGEPLSIREVARLIGCSEWTVRHRYLPQGIPHLRSGPMGKLMFFRNRSCDGFFNNNRKEGDNHVTFQARYQVVDLCLDRWHSAPKSTGTSNRRQGGSHRSAVSR